MADTGQIVIWTLEKQCPLRTGEAVTTPHKAYNAVSTVRHCCEAIETKRKHERYDTVVGDVYVTGFTSGAEAPKGVSRRGLWYPNSGRLVSEALKEVGGLEGAKAMCGNCPAHVSNLPAAGCVGIMRPDPSSPNLENLLRRAVATLGLEVEMRRHFLPTRPMWYGLWTKPILSPEAAALLRTVLAQVLAEIDSPAGKPRKPRRNSREEDTFGEDPGDDRVRDFRDFVNALGAAVGGQQLHLRFGKPGHTDFGSIWNWPHCPRCHARWKDKFIKKPVNLVCRVCGEHYTWREEMKETTEDHWPEEPTLREKLGPAFESWATDFFIAAGYEPEVAAEIVRLTEEKRSTEADPQEQQKRLTARREKARTRTIQFWSTSLALLAISTGLAIYLGRLAGWCAGTQTFVVSFLVLAAVAGTFGERRSSRQFQRWLDNKE